MLNFICTPCKEEADNVVYSPNTPGGHKYCKGGTWCDCQHRVERKTITK